MAPRSRRHIPRDNERTRLKTEQATRTETRRPEGEGSEENWMLERDRLLAIIRDRKDDLLKRRQAEKERLKREELEKQRLEILSARQKERLREIAPQAAQLSRWQQWVRRYRENLSAEGFTLSDGLWRSPINSDNIGNNVTFKDAKAKKLSDIPIEFPYGLGDPAYIYVSWDRAKYEHISGVWLSEIEEYLLDLGFNRKISRRFICLGLPKWGGFSSSQVPDFKDTVWNWPRANNNENHYHIHPPEDFSPYQILGLEGFRKTLRDIFKEKKYLKDPNRLPSPDLGGPREPLLQCIRRFSEVEIHRRIEKRRHFADVEIRHCIEKNRRIPPTRTQFALKPEIVVWFYDYRHMKMALEKLERFLSLCLRCCSWLNNVLPYRWSRRAARFYSWDWIPPPRPSPQYTYEVSGLLNEQPSSAFPDTGSDQNLLSRDYAHRNGIAIAPDSNGTTHIKSADGRLIPTIGTAQVSWSFDDSPHEKHMLVFHVLSQCVHDVLLGHPFLLETNTTTLNRIKRYTVNATSLSSTGAVYDIHAASGIRPGQCTTDGHLAGEAIKTLADTGAQVNIISLAYAQARNFKLDITGDRGTFRFIDGSEVPSIATVNAVWISSDKKQYSLKFEVLIGSSYDVILGQKHIYGTKALLGKKSDPSASPNSSHTTTFMTLDPLPAEPCRTPPASRNIEGSHAKRPGVDRSKASNVCAVGFKSPFAKASKAAKGLFSKTKKNDNLRPHLSSQAQEEIDRRATEESRQFRLTHPEISPPSDSPEASRKTSDSPAVAATSNDSASTASIEISTTTEPEIVPPSDTVAVENLTPEEYQAENAYLPSLSNLLLVNPIALCNYVWDSVTIYMSGQ